MQVRQYIQFSDLVKAIRKERGLSQRAMAKALDVSPGYIGQWELKLSQPSAQMAAKLCQVFGIDDVEYVQRLAYAQRAPEWLRDSILRGRDVQAGPMLRLNEQRIIDAVRRLPDADIERLAERIDGWVEAMEPVRSSYSNESRDRSADGPRVAAGAMSHGRLENNHSNGSSDH
ncbi:MAG: helix-turn-helix domain-containing protein [Myxococcota bacterium]